MPTLETSGRPCAIRERAFPAGRFGRRRGRVKTVSATRREQHVDFVVRNLHGLSQSYMVRVAAECRKLYGYALEYGRKPRMVRLLGHSQSADALAQDRRDLGKQVSSHDQLVLRSLV